MVIKTNLHNISRRMLGWVLPIACVTFLAVYSFSCEERDFDKFMEENVGKEDLEGLEEPSSDELPGSTTESDSGGPEDAEPEKEVVIEIPRVKADPLTDIKDPAPSVRALAVQDLADAPPSPEAVEALIDALQDTSITVSGSAGDTLGKWYIKGQVPAEELIRRARDPSLHPKTRTGILRGLSKVPTPEATELLLSMINEGEVTERRFAAGMIAYQGPEVAVPALIEALEDPDEWVRFNANEVLQHISRGRNYGQDKAAWRNWWGKAKAR